MNIKRLKSEQGFTIVELMIALAVLSTILVVVTVSMVQIGRLYTKGVNMANLQSTNRTLVSDIVSAIQFGATEPSPAPNCSTPASTCYANKNNYGAGDDVYSYCIDTIRYSYRLNREKGNDQSKSSDADTPHVLWRDKRTITSACDPVNIKLASPKNSDGTPSIGYDVIPEHMRLSVFKIAQDATQSRTYFISSSIAFGDDDLMGVLDADSKTTCKGGIGSQFCAVSQLTNSATRRLEN